MTPPSKEHPWPVDPYTGMVTEFQKAFKIKIPKHPVFPEVVTSEHKRSAVAARELVSCQREIAQIARAESKTRGGKNLVLSRFQLMTEELHEVMEAMCRRDPAQTVAELADLIYVTVGTANVLGLGDHLLPIFMEIHRANMSKLNPVTKEPYYDDSGKVTKGPYYQKPNIRRKMNEINEVRKRVAPRKRATS